MVESTLPSLPLTGVVKFHLHDSFYNPDPVIAVQDGKAIQQLKKVYGAFTAGQRQTRGTPGSNWTWQHWPECPGF